MSDTNPLVVLVENDLFFAGRILSVLKKAGYRTRTTTDGSQALHICKEELPAAVMVNLASSHLGGIELVRSLKALPSPPRVLAYLSHVKIPAVRDQVLAAGVDRLCPNSAVALRLPDIIRNLLADVGPCEEE